MLCNPVMKQSSISKFPDGAMERKRRQQCQNKTVGEMALINVFSIKTIPNPTLIIVNIITIKADIH